MKNKIILGLLLLALSGCAVSTVHRQCTQYMWVPDVDHGRVNYYIDRPVCVEWTQQ